MQPKGRGRIFVQSEFAIWKADAECSAEEDNDQDTDETNNDNKIDKAENKIQGSVAGKIGSSEAVVQKVLLPLSLKTTWSVRRAQGLDLVSHTNMVSVYYLYGTSWLIRNRQILSSP